MKRNVLTRTNVLICIVIILGFSLTSLISYHTNNDILKRDIEHISKLTSEGIYHQIDSIFSKPINISLTMANDNLLKSFLAQEETQGDEETYVQTMSDYLSGYKEKYGYDSVFLVSAQTDRYYHYQSGMDRVLTKDNSENDWYYSFMENSKEYDLNIDNDEVQSANNEINLFINCKIFSPDGEVLGVVGVGFNIDTMQEMLRNYEKTFQIQAYLVDSDGMVKISTDHTGYTNTDLFQSSVFGKYKENILSNREDRQSFWYTAEERHGFIVSCYIPNLEWYLLIDNDTAALKSQLYRQFFVKLVIVLIVIGAVLLIVTRIVRKYVLQIVNLTVEKEKSYRTIFQKETEKLYENIYEVDITHNQAASEATKKYFESLGVPPNMSYGQALQVVAREQIKKEYREGYIKTFAPEEVLKAYKEGKESICYDFMITNDEGHSYYWMRITARIFYWEEDKSVRMLIYRQNIDNEKQQELIMMEKMQRDSLSGLYNKAATQMSVRRLLEKDSKGLYVFFILDIDNFKRVNDTCGHAVGDLVITDFASKIKGQFREGDIVGRIGGDEFVVFVPTTSIQWVEMKVKSLSQALYYVFSDGEKSCTISASIGVAISPDGGTNFETLYKNADSALYETKEKGRNGYTIYEK